MVTNRATAIYFLTKRFSDTSQGNFFEVLGGRWNSSPCSSFIRRLLFSIPCGVWGLSAIWGHNHFMEIKLRVLWLLTAASAISNLSSISLSWVLRMQLLLSAIWFEHYSFTELSFIRSLVVLTTCFMISDSARHSSELATAFVLQGTVSLAHVDRWTGKHGFRRT